MKINVFRVGLVGTLGVGAGALILTSVVSLSTILTYVGAALFLALGLDPALVWLEKKGLPRWAAILIVMAGILAVFAGVIWAIVPIVITEVSRFVEQIPIVVSQLQDQAWVDRLNEQIPFIDFSSIVQNTAAAVTDFLQDPAKVSALAGGVLAFAVSVGSGFFGAIIVVILTMYLTASLSSIKRASYQLVPASKRERFADLTEQITSSVGRYVVGQITLAAANGVLSFIFLSIIRAPFPALLAVVAFALSLIPLVGTLTGSIIIVLTCLIPGLGSPLTALVAAIYYIIYMQIEAYVLSPHIMNRAVQVPGAVVVIAALAGGALLGILGALIAIPVAASILLIIKQVVIPRQNEL